MAHWAHISSTNIKIPIQQGMVYSIFLLQGKHGEKEPTYVHMTLKINPVFL